MLATAYWVMLVCFSTLLLLIAAVIASGVFMACIETFKRFRDEPSAENIWTLTIALVFMAAIVVMVILLGRVIIA